MHVYSYRVRIHEWLTVTSQPDSVVDSLANSQIKRKIHCISIQGPPSSVQDDEGPWIETAKHW